MLRAPTFRSPLDMSMRWCTTGWVDARPDTMDTKLSASLRVVLSPMKRNSYFKARCKSFDFDILVWEGGGQTKVTRPCESQSASAMIFIRVCGWGEQKIATLPCERHR